MDLVIALSAALAVFGLAYLAWPLLSHWYRVERFRHTFGSMTVAVFGKNGGRGAARMLG